MVVDNRRFHYAIAASLALHALLLFGFPDLIDTARRAASLPPILIARLMAPEPAPAPAPAESQPEQKPEIPKPVPRITKPVPRSPVVPEIKTESPAPPAEAAPPAPAPATPAAPAPVPPVAATQAQGTPGPSAPSEAPESLSRDQYRVQLIDEARRHKRYPPLARENNWQGDVRVGVAIAADGRPSVTLRGSSGYEVLDRQALDMFTQAARAVPVPPALRGKEFALEVRAIYGLEE